MSQCVCVWCLAHVYGNLSLSLSGDSGEYEEKIENSLNSLPETKDTKQNLDTNMNMYDSPKSEKKQRRDENEDGLFLTNGEIHEFL